MGKELRLLNASQVPPFTVDDETEANENTRLKYRYLDLRRPHSLAPLVLRYRMTKLIRDYLDGLGFIDVETPVLDQEHAGGGARLFGSEPHLSRKILRVAAVAAAVQADPDGRRPGPLFPDRQMFSR